MIFKKKKIISFMKKKKMNYILQVLELFPMGQIFFIINSKFNDDPIRLSIIN
jgi:DNA-binding protein